MPRSDRRRRSLRSIPAAALAVALLATGCGSSSPTTPPGASPAGLQPSTGATPVVVPATSGSPANSPPGGSTAAIDARSDALAGRLRAATYTAHTTAAAIEILARSGIETFEAPGSTTPRRAAEGAVSPLRLLDFQ